MKRKKKSEMTKQQQQQKLIQVLTSFIKHSTFVQYIARVATGSIQLICP